MFRCLLKIIIIISIIFGSAFGQITSGASSFLTVNGIKYKIEADGSAQLYTGWTTVNGERTFYYLDGVRQGGLKKISGVLYEFGEKRKLIGKYTGEVEKDYGTVYYRNGIRLKKTTTARNWEGISMPDINKFTLIWNAGGWIKLEVRVDKIYNAASQPQYDCEGKNIYVYVPYNLAPVIVNADGLYLSSDIIGKRWNDVYNPYKICPIVDGKLSFFKSEDMLVNLKIYKQSIFTDWDEDTGETSAINKDGKLYYYKDGITVSDLDEYAEAVKYSMARQEAYMTEGEENVAYLTPSVWQGAVPEGFSFRCTIIS